MNQTQSTKTKNNRKPKSIFYKDACMVFKIVSKNISDDKLGDEWQVIENTLFFAIAMEKLLKSILYDINPLYILEQPDFKNSVLVQYDSHIKDKSELNPKKFDEDVIAFQSSVLRCVVFSKTILKNKNTLMSLKHCRDIIVHHSFTKLDIEAMKLILKRDYYPFLSELSEEHNLGAQGSMFNNLHSKLAKISGELQDDITNQIKLKIESTKSRWDQQKGSSSFNKRKCEKDTLELLRKDFTYPANCPSCDNYAVVFTVPIMEYDAYSKEVIQTGLETKGLECKFCNLELLNYKELDILNVQPEIENKSSIMEEYSDENQHNK